MVRIDSIEIGRSAIEAARSPLRSTLHKTEIDTARFAHRKARNFARAKRAKRYKAIAAGNKGRRGGKIDGSEEAPGSREERFRKSRRYPSNPRSDIAETVTLELSKIPRERI